MSELAQALMVAIRCHAAQTDKKGAPYLLHVLRVVEAVSDEAKVVAALHDVLEDGSDEGYEAVMALNLPERVRRALALLTRDRVLSYASYIHVIKARDEIAREVKLADLKDNLGRIPLEPLAGRITHRGEDAYDAWVREWSGLKRRYERAIAILEGTA